MRDCLADPPGASAQAVLTLLRPITNNHERHRVDRARLPRLLDKEGHRVAAKTFLAASRGLNQH